MLHHKQCTLQNAVHVGLMGGFICSPPRKDGPKALFFGSSFGSCTAHSIFSRDSSGYRADNSCCGAFSTRICENSLCIVSDVLLCTVGGYCPAFQTTMFRPRRNPYLGGRRARCSSVYMPLLHSRRLEHGLHRWRVFYRSSIYQHRYISSEPSIRLNTFVFPRPSA